VSTIPSAPIRPWATSHRASSCSNSHLYERNESVTNLLDEYIHLTRGTDRVHYFAVFTRFNHTFQ